VAHPKLGRRSSQGGIAREKHFTPQYELFSIGSGEPRLRRWPRGAQTSSRAGDNRSNGQPRRSAPGWLARSAAHRRLTRSERWEFPEKPDWISPKSASLLPLRPPLRCLPQWQIPAILCRSRPGYGRKPVWRGEASTTCAVPSEGSSYSNSSLPMRD